MTPLPLQKGLLLIVTKTNENHDFATPEGIQMMFLH